MTSYATVLTCILALLSGLANSADAQVSTFSGTLSGDNEVPAVSPAGTGFFSATYDAGTMTLTVDGEFSDMTANVSACHIHDGAAGANGGVVFGMSCTSATSGTISGSGVLSEAQATDLFANGLYVNLHTSTNPGGEVRDQINFEGAQISTFSGILSGDNEVPAVSPAGTGSFSATYNPGTMTLTVNGAFSDMTANVSSCHVHDGAAGATGGVVFGMTCTSATSGTISGSGVLTDAQVTDLFADGLYVNLHTSTNPGGEIRDQIKFVATIDGNLNDARYSSLATKQNANSGFGSDINVSEIVAIADDASEHLYVGVKSTLDNASDNGIGVWLNFSEVAGASAGTALGGSPGAHYMGGNGGLNADFKADFEVDYMFAYTPNSDATDNFVDVVQLVGARTAEQLGNTGQISTTIMNGGGVFTAGSVLLAYQNGGGTEGLELCIPYSELGITKAGTLQAFAFVVSSAASFSDVTVPGNITSGNPGTDVDFDLLSGGPYHGGSFSLPVELVAFDAVADASDVLLTWTTASELNNSGFVVEHAIGSEAFVSHDLIAGRGTTTEAHTYTYRAEALEPGLHRFRLKQIDFDGTFTYSETVSVMIGIASTYVLEPIYPNPFNPTATFRFAVPTTQPVQIAVYNLVGQRVRVLFDGLVLGGSMQTVTFDGSDLPSGPYLIRLTGERFQTSQAVTLLK